MGLVASKKRLARYFAERFDFHERIEPVEDFLRACIGKMKGYRYIAFIFRIDANDWEPFFPEYLQWVMDTFSSISEECPTCLFFFPVWVRNLHDAPPQALREVADAEAGHERLRDGADEDAAAGREAAVERRGRVAGRTHAHGYAENAGRQPRSAS